MRIKRGRVQHGQRVANWTSDENFEPRSIGGRKGAEEDCSDAVSCCATKRLYAESGRALGTKRTRMNPFPPIADVAGCIARTRNNVPLRA